LPTPTDEFTTVSFGMAPPEPSHGKYYAVRSRHRAGARPSITFHVVPNTSPPDDYISLEIEIERTLAVLRVLFSPKRNKEKFDEYFGRLAELAGAALEQDQVKLGRVALRAFQDEIVTRETAMVKNAYIQRLGSWALVFGVPAIVFYLYCRYGPGVPDLLHRYREFVSMVAGSFLGTWLSFSIRRQQLSFWDLARLEEDSLDPSIRLLFVAGLTVVVGLLFATKAVVVTIGGFNSAFLNSGTAAVLIGCLCGIGEIGLPTAVGRRASEFVAVLGGAFEAGKTTAEMEAEKTAAQEKAKADEQAAVEKTAAQEKAKADEQAAVEKTAAQEKAKADERAAAEKKAKNRRTVVTE